MTSRIRHELHPDDVQFIIAKLDNLTPGEVEHLPEANVYVVSRARQGYSIQVLIQRDRFSVECTPNVSKDEKLAGEFSNPAQLALLRSMAAEVVERSKTVRLSDFEQFVEQDVPNWKLQLLQWFRWRALALGGIFAATYVLWSNR